MKKFLTLFLIILISTDFYSQNLHWQKIISNTKVAVKYYPPAKNIDNVLSKYESLIYSKRGVIQNYSDDKLNLELDFINYSDYTELNGIIYNKLKEDICFTIKIIFPFTQQDSVYWDHDLDSTILVEPNKTYANLVEATTVISPDGAFNISERSNGGYGDKIGVGFTSFYPIASVSTPSIGFGWGIDLGLPIVYRLYYNPSLGMIAEFDVSIVKETERFPNRSFFKIQLFEHDPEWHFRAALEKYYKINTEYFKKRVIKEGIWLPFTPLHTIRNYEDFGFAFHETNWNSKDKNFYNKPTIQADKSAGVYSFQYTEPWDIQIPIKKTDSLYEKGIVNQRILSKQIYEELKTSVIFDKNGFWQARRLKTPWFNTGYAVSITTNASPLLINSKRYRNIRDEEINPALQLNVDGIYFDSMEWNWHYDLNYNRDHFRTASYPLTFSTSLGQPKPSILNYSSQYEMMKCISEEMHVQGKLTMGNGYGWMPFSAGILDLFGTEINWYIKSDTNKKRLQFFRSISFQKPVVLLLNEGLEDTTFTKPPYIGYEKYFSKMLAYGFFPSFFSTNSSNNPYWEDSTKYNIGRKFFKKYIPLIQTISAAGWQPKTYASTQTKNINIERFGNSPQNGLYFTIYNISSKDEKVIIIIEANRLKLNNIIKILDLISGENIQFLYSDEKLILTTKILSENVQVLKLINPH
ncbi:MAG: hypothetical protein HZA74_14210 [Ignavibacteriales bacterium]|uniref:Uncharacterized protein n=1 Tax=Stygiobacter electus TaxID=3032292 RepID=A0AAE3NXY9_9BACT|nr:hypothetical protein [Stygiobacter electus]MBI5809542.1 hypothetical protein [Ignavibacteriales bacterium]MDF1610639.1 hypothetical protein [Stygiobacter electus]